MSLSLNNTQIAFAYKSTAELKRARFLFSVIQSPIIVSLATKLTPVLMNSGLPINGLIRSTIFNQFVGGETLEETARVAKQLGAYGVQIILDYGVEAKEGEENFDNVTEKIMEAVEFASTQNNIPFVSIKLTGIASVKLLETLNEAPRLRSGIHDSEIEDAAWERVKERMYAICDLATEKGVGILLDAEETWIQDPIDRLAIELMAEYNKEKVVVYNTYQLYRSDRYHFLQLSHKIAKEKNFKLGAKLVRGAYMEKERLRAKEEAVDSPIHLNKEATDKDFNDAAAFCIQNKETISLILASHNELSNLKIAQLMSEKGIPAGDPHVHFSQLYGMSDTITFNMAKEGYNVSKYLPFGPIKDVIPYLMRRAEENSSVNGQTSRELLFIRQELVRRKVKK
ncbi:MAG: proline dehydrogenase [Chitinophagia bacterium]|nr:proline dehydrogenase [Chitinophagia bacterium]NCA29420.1 proline dehydrogenase [Chitinophagia bacterium]